MTNPSIGFWNETWIFPLSLANSSQTLSSQNPIPFPSLSSSNTFALSSLLPFIIAFTHLAFTLAFTHFFVHYLLALARPKPNIHSRVLHYPPLSSFLLSAIAASSQRFQILSAIVCSGLCFITLSLKSPVGLFCLVLVLNLWNLLWFLIANYLIFVCWCVFYFCFSVATIAERMCQLYSSTLTIAALRRKLKWTFFVF